MASQSSQTSTQKFLGVVQKSTHADWTGKQSMDNLVRISGRDETKFRDDLDLDADKLTEGDASSLAKMVLKIQQSQSAFLDAKLKPWLCRFMISNTFRLAARIQGVNEPEVDDTSRPDQIPVNAGDDVKGMSEKEFITKLKESGIFALIGGKLQVRPLSIDHMHLQNLSVTSEKIAHEAVTVGKIGTQAVTRDCIGDNAVLSVHLEDEAVTTEKIAENGVTNEKVAMDAVTTRNIVDAAVTGPKMADLTVDASKIASEAVTTDKIGDHAITNRTLAPLSVRNENISPLAVDTEQLINNAVTSDKLARKKMAARAVDSRHIVHDAVRCEHIANQQVVTSKIADGSVDTSKLQNNAVATDKIQHAAVTNEKIGQVAVTTEKIQDAAVTTDKIQHDAVTNEKLGQVAVTTKKIHDAAVHGAAQKQTFSKPSFQETIDYTNKSMKAARRPTVGDAVIIMDTYQGGIPNAIGKKFIICNDDKSDEPYQVEGHDDDWLYETDVTAQGQKMKVGVYTLPDGTKVPNLCPLFPASPAAVKVNEWPNASPITH